MKTHLGNICVASVTVMLIAPAFSLHTDVYTTFVFVSVLEVVMTLWSKL